MIVFDADTGAFKRMWGAYGKPPKDPQQKDAFGSDRAADSFSVTHCVVPDNLGLLYKNWGRYEEAEPVIKQALAIRRGVLGDQHPDTAESLNNLAGLSHEQGRYAEAG